MIKTGMEFITSHPLLTQAISRVMIGDGLYYGNTFADVRERTAQGLKAMINQAIASGEVDPSVEVELAVMIMETWSKSISTYILNEGLKQKDIMKWVRSAKTQETIDKLLCVMEYGLRKTDSEITASLQKGNHNDLISPPCLA